MTSNISKAGSYIITFLAGIGIVSLFSNAFDTSKEEQSYQERIDLNYNIYSLSIPEQVTFADEIIPLKDFELKERLDRELHVNTYFHSQTIIFFKRANRWFPVIEPILKEQNIPDDFKYLALIESGLDNVISPAGATGFWQFMKPTALEYGLEINEEVDERYNVEKATRAACKYLKKSYEKFGSWSLVAASYNAGMSRIESQLNRQMASSYWDLLLNTETERYVFRIAAVKIIFENPENFGFNIRKKDLYKSFNLYTDTITGSVENFAAYAKEKKINYKILKFFNPWLRENYLKNKSGNTYVIKLPQEGELN
ncbi:lytic transglycosylase domain-containing protein [Acidiluteibacter ferrifornacis]|uniref:Transglycosylase SLT domain-containing protein n=1 Tax=Acidiluteibacter ferrifornacis TaxID=2692424 RepID=A0A6N9NKX1_9FLAO|nr:lytic transglycosylase domain-containing protein [Acidiluteibacter ferrifornacis]NBG65807.1 transglycosylase SLT domain-containing protein [Acidiluteibacter ferrifornacis]